MPIRTVSGTPEGGPTVVAFTARDRTRTLLKKAFPRRRGRVLFCRTASELGATFGKTLVDLVVVDVAAAGDDTWRAAGFAAEFPCTPFFGKIGRAHV